MPPSTPTTAPPVAWVIPLAGLARTDLEVAGGKGANLGELVRGGFPVPPGFVVTTAAYDRFVADNGLGEIIDRALRDTPGDGSAIRAAFEAAPIPPEIERQVRAAYQVLGQPPVAVRSSATAEDLPAAAFAGQQDTYLNLIGPEAVLDAVRRCWASLWTDRAMAYRARQGVDPRTVRLAAVVQRLVPAEAAGVLFTANPITGTREEVVVAANPGLGEAVVSGEVTPDHFGLRRRWWGWRITARRPGQRELIIRPRAGGGTEHSPAPAGEAGPAVPDVVLRRLAALGAAIQRHFGSPQDVEWAWAGGSLYILQARPMTALPSPPPRTNPVLRALAGNFAELFAVRPYPLDVDVWVPALAGAIEPMLGLLGLDLRLRRMFEVEDGIVVGFQASPPHPTWRTPLTPLRLLPLIWRYNPQHWQADPALAAVQKRAQALEAQAFSALTWEALLVTVHAAMRLPWDGAGELRRRYFPRAALAGVWLRLLLGLLGRSREMGALLAGVDNKTLEVNRALEALAKRVRSDPELARLFETQAAQTLGAALETRPEGRIFLAALGDFLGRYGHREAAISTAALPTWKDAPEVVLGIIKGLAAQAPAPHAAQPGWEAARARVLAHPLLRLAPLRSSFFQALAAARTLVQIREDTHFEATRPLPILRRAALEMGRRLVEAGVLDAGEEAFHLTLAELERAGENWPPPAALAGELRAAMVRRKAQRARLADTPLVDPRLLAARLPAGEGVLRGLPGSPGVAEGPARIVRDGFEFDKLQPGDVLVAPYTNPSWTPLFQRAAAAVIDSGSAASHAAIVAREYGLPAVMSTVTGTRTLHDGEYIRVDGSQGAVYRLGEQAPAPPAASEREAAR